MLGFACFVPPNWLLVQACGCDLSAFPLSCSICLNSGVKEEGTYSIFVCTCIALKQVNKIGPKRDLKKKEKNKYYIDRYQEGFQGECN